MRRSFGGAEESLLRKVEGDRDPKPVLQAALPHLLVVSINGADQGDTRAMEWDRLIQPLGRGTYEVASLL